MVAPVVECPPLESGRSCFVKPNAFGFTEQYRISESVGLHRSGRVLSLLVAALPSATLLVVVTTRKTFQRVLLGAFEDEFRRPIVGGHPETQPLLDLLTRPDTRPESDSGPNPCE